MAYTFEKYGVFTGPGTPVEFRDNDDFSLEPLEVTPFNLDDVAMVLANKTASPADYVYLHLNGTSTSTLTLERNVGPIPAFNVEADLTTFSGDVVADGTLDGTPVGRLESRIALADSRPKPFDMVHPSLGEGNRLRYACIEGPEVGVYFRGRITDSNEIELPWYWKDLVHTNSISVQLQPIGTSQEIIVERWDDQKVYIKEKNNNSIDCFYHVYAERKDVNSLVVEYQGDTWEDYPDKNYNDPIYANKINTKTL